MTNVLINAVYILFGLFATILSTRYEYGIFSYTISLNYTVLSFIGIEYIRIGAYLLANKQTEVNYLQLLIIILLVLLNYDSTVTLNVGQWLIIILQRIILILCVYTAIICYYLDILYYFIEILICLDLCALITARWLYRDQFRYGTLHQRYNLLTAIMYIIFLCLCVIDQYKLITLYDLHYIIMVWIFNYHYQLNMFYKLSRYEYITSIRSGWFSYIILIVDYYELPEPKI